MAIVKRWFMKTEDGAVIDGPYSDHKEFMAVVRQHIKWYKFTPVISEEEVDDIQFMQIKSFDAAGYNTGKGRPNNASPKVVFDADGVPSWTRPHRRKSTTRRDVQGVRTSQQGVQG